MLTKKEIKLMNDALKYDSMARDKANELVHTLLRRRRIPEEYINRFGGELVTGGEIIVSFDEDSMDDMQIDELADMSYDEIMEYYKLLWDF